MRVLLIDPPFYRICGFYNRYFPVGLVTLATFLRQNGFPDTRVYDADYNQAPRNIDYARLPDAYGRYLASFHEPEHPVWREVRHTLRQKAPAVVGISLWTTYAAAGFFTARIAKEVNPDCIVVAGGPHATAKAEEVLSICPDIDFVIRGDGEQPLRKLLHALSGGDAAEVSEIAGVSFRDAYGLVHTPPETVAIQGGTRIPDRTLLMHSGSYNSEDMGLIMSSRGCPFGCTFCATPRKKVTLRAPEQVVAEMRQVKRRYGTVQFTFKDDSFTIDPRRVRRFCEQLIKSRLKVNWECNTRITLMDTPLLRLMKMAGCNFVKVGVESGSARVLAAIRKGITLSQIRKGAHLLRTSGLHWTGYFMIGVPGETETDIHRTMAFLHELGPDFACIGIYEPFPGTPMFADGIRRGLVKDNMTYADFFNTKPNNYYKTDAGHQTDTIDQRRFERLAGHIVAEINRYNRHPRRVLKMFAAKARGYARRPEEAWSDFKKFLRY